MTTTSEPTWTITRSQLIDAIAGITVRGTALTGFRDPVVVADDMADAILRELTAEDVREAGHGHQHATDYDADTCPICWP